MKDLKELTIEELQTLIADAQSEISRRNAELAPLPEGATKIDIAQGYIDQRNLGYEDHRRGTNYIAVVKFNPSQPGGLDRTFFEKGSGSFRELPDLEVNDIIEVAHDYTSSGGNRSRRRDFYKIIRQDVDVLYLLETEKPTK